MDRVMEKVMADLSHPVVVEAAWRLFCAQLGNSWSFEREGEEMERRDARSILRTAVGDAAQKFTERDGDLTLTLEEVNALGDEFLDTLANRLRVQARRDAKEEADAGVATVDQVVRDAKG